MRGLFDRHMVGLRPEMNTSGYVVEPGSKHGLRAGEQQESQMGSNERGSRRTPVGGEFLQSR